MCIKLYFLAVKLFSYCFQVIFKRSLALQSRVIVLGSKEAEEEAEEEAKEAEQNPQIAFRLLIDTRDRDSQLGVAQVGVAQVGVA